MKTRIASSLLVLGALLLLFGGTALAHFVTPTCGSVTFNDTTKGWTAVVQPGDLVFGQFTHDGDNGPYKIAAGSYTYQFVDTYGKNQEYGKFKVEACSTPAITSTPSASPSHPHATPRATPPHTDATSTNTTTANDAVIATNWAFVILVIAILAALTVISLAYFDRPRDNRR